MDKCLDNGCIKLAIRLVRWVPVIFIAFVLSWAYYVYVYHICINQVHSNLQRIVYLIAFHILFIMMLWSYVQTIFTPIGVPPSSFDLTREVKDDLCAAVDEQSYRAILERFVRQNKIPVHNRAFESGVRFCIKCSAIKPDRSHHCSICSQCILKFDHHCPWVNTCINYRNYKFFVLFLGYGFYLCVFGFFSILPYFIGLWQNNEFGRHGMATFHVFLLFLVAAMFGISMGCLFVYHMYLTAKNKSTLESFRPPMFHYGVDKNAYNLGIKRNFVEVFGKNRLLWLIPVFTSLGDGIVYQQQTGAAAVESASISTNASNNDLHGHPNSHGHDQLRPLDPPQFHASPLSIDADDDAGKRGGNTGKYYSSGNGNAMINLHNVGTGVVWQQREQSGQESLHVSPPSVSSQRDGDARDWSPPGRPAPPLPSISSSSVPRRAVV